MASLSQANLVVLARNFNPSIVSKEWLWKKRIIRETASNFVYTPPFSLIEVPSLTLTLDENRLQITLKDPASSTIAKLTQAARRFIGALPETPYTALGFNFRFVAPGGALSLETIILAQARVSRMFGQDYELGARVAFSFEDFMVKAEIPAAVPAKPVAEISFNFHSDVSSGAVVLDRLSRHGAALRKARAIAEAVTTDA